MTSASNTEAYLLKLLDSHSDVEALDGGADFGVKYGVVLSLRGRPLGLWSLVDEHFVFRELGSYQPILTAETATEATDLSIALLRHCQFGWAERLGGLPEKRQAA